MVSTPRARNLASPGNRVDRRAIEDGLRAAGSGQYRRSLAHRQIAAQRQRLEQRREARAWACRRHVQLRGLAAAAARHARHVRMQPGLELEKSRCRQERRSWS